MTYQVQVGAANGWFATCSDEAQTFSPQFIAAGEDAIRRWAPLFPKEENWAENQFKVPSLIVRVDCTVIDGQLGFYEVEERPAGMGLTGALNPQFAELFAAARRKWWPEVTAMISPRRRADDDYLWTRIVTTPDSPVIIRSDPDESDYWQYQALSISSLRHKGDKSYGVELGWWREVRGAHELPWDQAFVLKPVQGSKARGMWFWNPATRRNGYSTRSQVGRALAAAGRMYCQLWLQPMSGPNGYTAMIYRVYYIFNPEMRSWSCLGGHWVARNDLRLHGASDALLGPVTVS